MDGENVERVNMRHRVLHVADDVRNRIERSISTFAMSEFMLIYWIMLEL